MNYQKIVSNPPVYVKMGIMLHRKKLLVLFSWLLGHFSYCVHEKSEYFNKYTYTVDEL